jgi:hypothetical protein
MSTGHSPSPSKTQNLKTSLLSTGALGSLTECQHFVDLLKAVSKPRAGALGSLTECPLDIRPFGVRELIRFNLMYVWYTMRQSLWSWPMGIIGVILSFLVYVNYALYSDATLQVFYGVLCLYGWWQWQQPVMSPKGYHRMSPGLIVIATGIGIIGDCPWVFSGSNLGLPYPFGTV